MKDMRNRYRISVIVPVYNKKKYLSECIDSILAQTYRNIELLLVDDSSTDGSGELCERYAALDGRIQVIHRPNGGPTAACVTGMEHARGDYYMFVDSDDYIDACMLEEMAAHLTGRAGEIVCCDHMLEKRKKTILVTSKVRPGIYEGARLEREVKEKLIGEEQRLLPMSRCMKLCERSVFDGNEKYYDMSIRMGDDFHLIYPALLDSTRIVVMEQAAFYHYRYVEDSIVHGYDAGMFQSVEAWRRAMERILADKKVRNGEERLRREYCYMLMIVMKNELRGPDRNYLSAIRKIFGSRTVRECVMDTRLTVQQRSNQLMYLGMKYPEAPLLRILRMIVKWHDKEWKISGRLQGAALSE